jgi:hypothetical protein
MPISYVDRLPHGLRRALAEGRWLPLIGAGLSANASTADGRRPPAWQELGKEFSKELEVATAAPIDALSAFQALYDRPYLINRLADLLFVNDVEPGPVHQAFAQLPFDIVVTTNIDFLLERAYQEQRRPWVPLLGESQLTIQRRPEATYLLKFHGDIHHPDHLVVTEDDYDGFLQRHPILTTYLSSLFLGREPVLIGYSLDDPDLREILTLLRERLGRMTRAVWAILPADPHREQAKFERRGLKPIVLDLNAKASRPEVFEQFFRDLRTLWEGDIATRLATGSDASTAELRRQSGIAPQLGLFVASRPMLSLYRDFVFPTVPQSGLIAIGEDIIRVPERSMVPMAIDIALSKAAVVVYDTGRGNAMPLEYVAARRQGKPIVVVTGEQETQRNWLLPPGVTPLSRPTEISAWPQVFVHDLVEAMLYAQPASSLPAAIQPSADTSTPAPSGAPLSPSDAAALGPDLSDQLKELRSTGDWQELLLTTLALLEAELRGSEAPQVGMTIVPTSGGRMDQLQGFFGPDFEAILAGVRLRHDLLQGLAAKSGETEKRARSLEEIVRRRRDLPSA